MKDYKNIDRLFQEKFRDFESLPPERVWNHIENNMNPKPITNQRNMWIWFSGIAVGLTLLFVFNNPFNSFLAPTNELNSVVDNENSTPLKPQAETETTTDVDFNLKNMLSVPINKGNNHDSFETNSISSNSKTNLKFPILKSNNPFKVDNQSKDFVLGKSNKKEVLFSSKNHSGTESLTETEALSNSDANPDKGWSVSTVAAPVYLSSFNKDASALDSQMDANEKQGKISTAYGVQVAYQFNKRFSIQSGVHIVDFAYSTNDIYLASNNPISRFSNINYDDTKSLISTISTNPSTFSKSSDLSEKGNLTQVYGYIEIPLEAKYRLNADDDLGINIIGGFSTLLLNKNEIYVETSDFTNKVGEASNLNSLNFSGNLGVELEYKVYKNVNFNLVPMFKIQTHTLNNTNAFKPYSVGLYSGLNLRF
jgi:hypothetical protein